MQQPWRVVFTARAQKDARRLAEAGLRPKEERPIEILRANPYQSPSRFEKLVADLTGTYPRRIAIHDRLVYRVIPKERTVKILRRWTHYEWCVFLLLRGGPCRPTCLRGSPLVYDGRDEQFARFPRHGRRTEPAAGRTRP
ncbi:MAG: Txe/YoeB family addiction module toxin [Acidobacteria bacterium]|nr:Txe/YoeB family addiction module toxin [Acidobacteriota bacterium]